MACSLTLLLFTIMAVSGQDSPAPQSDTPAAKKKKTAGRKPPPAMQPPEVQPGLPNVLLIGDSISIGYTVAVREELSNEANVWRPKTNCGPTTKGVAAIDQWIGDRKWDVIHWNHGLHDLKYMGPNNENLADPAVASSHQQVPPDDYAKNLKTIAERLKKTGATIIFCETTPVPNGAKGRVVGDSKKYNAIAEKVMGSVTGIVINPLYQFAVENIKNLPANVHYSKEGSQKLGTQVASVIRQHLDQPKAEAKEGILRKDQRPRKVLLPAPLPQ